jgi:glycosyltransferase involved in cell wall biosynthesis
MKADGNHEFLKVAFDASALKPQYDHHGIQVYTRNLLAALQGIAGPNGMEIRPFIPSAKTSNVPILAVEPGFRPRKSALMQFDRLWRYGGATAAAFLDGADIMLSPNGTSLPISTLLPTVTTIHDLTPMVMPCYPRRTAFFLKFLLGRSAKSSAAIITVSENSRRDIIRICGVPESKVHVVYEGYDRALFNAVPPELVLLQQLLRSLGIDRPYILHHGAVQPRKNLPRLIAAYRQMLARNPQFDLDLVLAGPLVWQHEETVNAAGDDSASRGKVLLTGALNDRDLSLLVRGASLEVIPSLYEGFCLPMVEAMACGLPTIAANTSCLPEISGGVLRYFNPNSVEDIVACMESVLLSRDLQTELAERGIERAQKFSWDLCAQETMAILEQVARGREVHSRAAGVAL